MGVTVGVFSELPTDTASEIIKLLGTHWNNIMSVTLCAVWGRAHITQFTRY